MKKVLALAVLVLLVAGGVAFGQAQKGSIRVTVVAEDGSVLPGAVLEATSDQTLSRRSGVTDAQGQVDLVALDPATNYVVTTTLDGFNGARNENVIVRAGLSTPIRVTLTLATVSEELIVTSESPIVDITSAATGQDITLQLTESLPTARTYQDYLQLVPGVMPAVVDDEGINSPASRSGLNYADINGDVGVSRDNFFYFEGINVTDSVQGYTRTNINTEIIQEQSVLTGGLPAEFVGASGLVSNVITKSGGNEFSGSVNYYFQDDNLVADNKNRQDATFSTYDTAVTFGGPIARDRAWFFASYRNVNRQEDVIDLNDVFLRTVERDEDQWFGKITWAPTSSGLLTGTFLSDPADRNGSFDVETSNSRDRVSERGGERYLFNYSHVWNTVVFEVGYSEHDADINDIPTDLSTRNDINFRSEDLPVPIQEAQIGGFGTTSFETRGTEQVRGAVEVLADTSWGSHTIKGGVELSENNDTRDFRTTGDRGTYTSLDDRYLGQGVTAGELADVFQGGGVGTGGVQFDPNNTSDMNGLRGTIDAHPRRADFYALLDLNHDGFIDGSEVAEALVFDTTEGNPNGMINYDRLFQVADGLQFTHSEGTILYLQDTWQHKKWSANVGVRAEQWEHFATDGTNVYTFDWDYAPRVSLMYDLGGNGRQRLSAYYGRYYDPIRNNMTNFAGSITGRERHEQVYIDGDWLTYRIRGGPTQPDANFAPTTRTPYTDEYQLGYKIDLGRNMSVEANVVKRETRDILEDYDLSLYADPETYGLPVDHPESLFLGLDYFGFDGFPNANFFIGTIAGGARDWDGFELIFRKRMSNNWQMLASYNRADAEGNTNSDSNADFQGDVLWLDPRAINQFGTQPGLIEDLFKVAGTYQWDNGISVGAAYRWNSGAIVSRTFSASRRNLPVRDFQDPLFDGLIQFAGGSGRGVAGGEGAWLSPFAVGQFENPSYGVFDLRLSYLWRISGRFETDFFLDVFNVLDQQDAIRTQDLIAGGGGVDFGEGVLFVEPRRFYLGARLRF